MIAKEETSNSYMVLLKDNRGAIEKIAFPHAVQVGLDNIPKELILTGRLSLSIGDYKCRPNGSISIDDNHTIANIEPLQQGQGTLYVKLPIKPREGQILVIKDLSGTAQTNNIAVSSWDASSLIDSSQSKTINKNYGFLGLYWHKNSWRVYFDGGSGDGSQGPPGPKGDKGDQGLPGQNGLNGLSAYEIWLQTNTGSEEDFLNSLKGDIGAQGPKGDKGDQGLPGETPNLIAGNNITITPQDGSLVISSTAGSNGSVSNVFYKKGQFLGLNIDEQGILDFSSVGELIEGFDPITDIDVYLNGQLLTLGEVTDYTVPTRTTIQFGPIEYFDTDIISIKLATTNTTYEAGPGISISTSAGGVVTISNTSEVQDLVWNERLTGNVDGINTQFEMQYIPSSPDTLMIFLNGVLQEPGGEDFNLSGKIVTMNSPPMVGSKITATYSK